MLRLIITSLIFFLHGSAILVRADIVQAVAADSFVESIGVNTHWAYPNVYRYNYTGLKQKLGDVGIRYIRDGANAATYNRSNDLFESLGIRMNMLTGRRSGGYPAPLDPTQIDAELNEIKTQALNVTISIEAPNEYDISHGPDTDWIGNIKNYSSTLYAKVKADELLKNLPVIGPSLTKVESYEAVGNSDSFIDYVNLHLYQANRWPGNNGWGSNGYGSITWAFNWLARFQSPSFKPIQATESGYNNDLPSGGISEIAECKYTTRMFAEFFRRGILRTYKYELVNQGQAGREGAFGLLRNDLSEKPIYQGVKNLISIFGDKGADFTPSTLDYALDHQLNDSREILFQKRNGDFYLMMWLELPSWDFNNNTDLNPPAQQVLLTILHNIYNISNATLYEFGNDCQLTVIDLQMNNNQVEFDITDRISVVKLTNSTSHT